MLSVNSLSLSIYIDIHTLLAVVHEVMDRFYGSFTFERRMKIAFYFYAFMLSVDSLSLYIY